MTYYAVYFPPGEYEDTQSYVSESKNKVLEDVKKYKKARFKPFDNYQDALVFVTNGPMQVVSSVSFGGVEKSSPHRAPKIQELSYFRKAIETNNFDIVQQCVSHNPRYLVSSGDTPSILQEGFRYNALHIAAKANCANVISYILRYLSSVDFMKFLYGEDEDPELLESRSNVLVDLYLNTPDKGMNETPLHFASKFGSLESVKVLISYSQCNKSCVNKNNETPLDIVGSRKADLKPEIKQEISRLLECEYFIAVLRSPDRSVEPILAEPFPISSPPTPKRGVMSADLEVSAIAGPMKEEDALIFRKKWKKPMSSPITSPKSINESQSCDNNSPLKYSFMDPDKRIESIGRELSVACGVPWSEYWPFMQAFANFRTESGLEILEKYLERKHFSEDDKTPEKKSVNINVSNSEVISPVSQLCSIFDKLSLDKKKSPNILETSGKVLSYLCIDRTAKIYAKKIAQVIPSADIMTVLTEITRLHFLISSCAQDERYRNIEFNRIHSRLSSIVKELLSSNKENIKNHIIFFEELLKSNYLSDLRRKEKLYQATYCLCNKIISALKSETLTCGNESGDTSLDDEFAYRQWMASEICHCNLEFKGKSYRQSLMQWKKLNFNGYSSDEDDGDPNKKIFNAFLDSNDNRLMSVENIDEEEEEFFTPPTSPPLSSASSMDDIYSADEGSPVFILGSYPTKVDTAVYDAIDDKLVTPRKYPYIYQWLHCYKRQSRDLTNVFSPLSPDVQKRLNRLE